jgi:hypothetical protein
MPKFKIPVTWIADGTVKTKAETLDAAVNEVEKQNMPFPSEQQNLIGTMQVDFERVEEMNPGHTIQES